MKPPAVALLAILALPLAPIPVHAGEGAEALLRLLDSEQHCTLSESRRFGLEMEANFIENSDGMIAATLHRLNEIVPLDDDDRKEFLAWALRQEKSIVEALENFAAAGGGVFTLTAQEKTGNIRWLVSPTAELLRLRQLCTGANNHLTVLTNDADTPDWTLSIDLMRKEGGYGVKRIYLTKR